ncbi:DUF4249 family protein [Labilibacter marinus]|uniref:DUF4249 family protein n=1 Tax=Labilibacter marinus TaxID=1477105 RepID=UPI00082A2F47|nr:DUF4249 family protein [Labilibacter marinus]
MRIIIFALLLLLTVSCSKNIEIEQPYYEPKIVVDGWIAEGGFANIYLTKSSPFLTNYDSASIRATFVNYAKLTVSNSKGQSEILTLFRKEQFFPPFVYKTTQLRGEVGETYHLKIEVEGKVITSTTTIPDLPNVTNIVTEEVSDTTMNIEVEVQDEASINNYYYSEIKVQSWDSIFHPSSLPLTRDTEFNGKEGLIRIYRSSQPDPLNIYNIESHRNLPLYEFSQKDTAFLKFSCVDASSFHVLNDIYLDGVNSSNPFAFVNKKTGTNISGGIGRWTGLATKYFVISKEDVVWSNR